MHLKEERIVVVTRVILDEENDRKRISGTSTTSMSCAMLYLRESLAPPRPLLRVLFSAAAVKRLLLVGGSLVHRTHRQAACNPYSQPGRDISKSTFGLSGKERLNCCEHHGERSVAVTLFTVFKVSE